MTTGVRILGIDPGSRITGYGVIETGPVRCVYVASGCIRTGSGLLPARLRTLFESVGELIRCYAPDEFAIERVFMYRNADSALKLGHARGVALCAAAQADLPIGEYTPAEIKQAIGGHGAAGKPEIRRMIASLLLLGGLPQTDAADALAVAVCHGHQRALQQRLLAAGRG